MSMNVTDFKWKDKTGRDRVGYYMDEFLAMNLMSIPQYLAKAWDAVGIISGHGKVRIGKSTLGVQVGLFVAWLLAGGKMEQNKETGRWYVAQAPTKPVNFSLDNLIFCPEDLIKKADDLYKKYGKNQVMIYDEGRSGLDSARAMESINKVMMDFFQECGFMGHVILIVLPNYFKLHEDYAVNRSLFLIDTFTDDKLRRGHFAFYNEVQKEWLYFMGKKKVGVTLKYQGCKRSFTGRFSDFFPIDKEKYEEAKRAGIKKKQMKTIEKRWKRERDAALFLIKRISEWDYDSMALELSAVAGHRIGTDSIKNGISNVIHQDISSDGI